MLFALALLASASTASAVSHDSVQSMIDEEPADVFLAKAALQQYLSRIVRKDWDGVKRLTHPKTLAAIAQSKSRTLAPWTNEESQLKTFRFVGARQIAPGVVAVQVGEDVYHPDEQNLSTDEPAVYLVFKSHGGFLVGDKRPGANLNGVRDGAIRVGYSGFVDGQAQAQARRDAAIHGGHHR